MAATVDPSDWTVCRVVFHIPGKTELCTLLLGSRCTSNLADYFEAGVQPIPAFVGDDLPHLEGKDLAGDSGAQHCVSAQSLRSERLVILRLSLEGRDPIHLLVCKSRSVDLWRLCDPAMRPGGLVLSYGQAFRLDSMWKHIGRELPQGLSMWPVGYAVDGREVIDYKQLHEALEIVKAHRRKGIKCGLVTLSEVPRRLAVWGLDKPTLGCEDTCARWYGKRETMVPESVAAVAKVLSQDRSCTVREKLARVVVANLSPNLVLAGGAVCCAIREIQGRANDENDWDLFIVGKSAEEGQKIIEGLIEKMAAVMGDDGKLSVFRTETCVTINFPRYSKSEYLSDRPFQIILREYSYLSEVLHGFDIAPCAVAFDGKEVYFTETAALAYRVGVFELDLVARRNSYERRLQKYVNRGFMLVLPDLDVAAVRARGSDTVTLYGLSFYTTGHGPKKQYDGGNSIASSNVYVESRGRVQVLSDEIKTDDAKAAESSKAEAESSKAEAESSKAESSKAEVDAEMKGPESSYDSMDGNYQCAYAIGRSNISRFLSKNTRWIVMRADAGSLWDGAPVYTDTQIRDRFSYVTDRVKDGTLSVKSITKLLGDEQAARRACAGVFLEEDGKDKLLALIDKAEERFKEEMAAFRLPVQWKGVTEGTNLIGPFTANVVTEKEWYGEFYHAN